MRLQPSTSTAQALLNVFVYRSRPKPRIPSVSIDPAPTQRPSNSGLKFRPLQFRRYASVNGTKDQRLRDREIMDREVCLVQADGTLGPPAATSHVLRTFDPALYHLVQLSPSQGNIPTVCKIISKRELREKERMTRKPAVVTTKHLELNWAIDANDLGHRLKRMQDFLSQGRLVEVLLDEKKKGRKATSEEAKAVIQAIRAKAMEVEGTKESKHMEGTMLKQVTLFFQGMGKVSQGEAKS
ncbi:MAG: hypothetical protein M1812_005460 [Candelaria pacifica]|nr:MAG: hypothetical protein M1812_005460 [Candelaria pacifica]